MTSYNYSTILLPIYESYDFNDYLRSFWFVIIGLSSSIFISYFFELSMWFGLPSEEFFEPWEPPSSWELVSLTLHFFESSLFVKFKVDLDFLTLLLPFFFFFCFTTGTGLSFSFAYAGCCSPSDYLEVLSERTFSSNYTSSSEQNCSGFTELASFWDS